MHPGAACCRQDAEGAQGGGGGRGGEPFGDCLQWPFVRLTTHVFRPGRVSGGVYSGVGCTHVLRLLAL